MATTTEIAAALECHDCSDALEWHLTRCRPTECEIVNAWTLDTADPKRSAMAAMMAGAAGTHESHDHRVVHDPPIPDLDDDLSL